MDLFVFATLLESAHSENVLAPYVEEAVSHLKGSNVRAEVSYIQDDKLLQAVVSVNWTGHISKIQQDHVVLQQLAEAIAKYIVEVKESRLVSDMITSSYKMSTPEQLNVVKDACHKLLYGEKDQPQSKNQRISVLTTVFHNYLQQQQNLHIDGFIRFRLQGYKTQLKETIDFAIDEYLLDKQYEEFIGLLQYFVHFQEPLTPLVHLMHIRGNEFSILNSSFSTVQASAVSGVVAKIADQELELEDIVVSTLISLSPERIVIHTRDPEVVIISTIRRIFGDRVELCLQCSHCNVIHQGARRTD